MTNGDKIRAMTDEELSINHIVACRIIPKNHCAKYDSRKLGCVKCKRDYLKQEATDDKP